MRRWSALAVALVLGAAALPATASAQGYGYGDGYGRGSGSYGYDRGGYDRGGYDRGEYGRYRENRSYGYERRSFGSLCVTARGDCRTRPAPFNTPCGCEIPGFGYKRGAIGAY